MQKRLCQLYSPKNGESQLPQVLTADKIRSVTASLQPKERREQPSGIDSSSIPCLVWEDQKKLNIGTVVDCYWSLRCHIKPGKIDLQKKGFVFSTVTVTCCMPIERSASPSNFCAGLRVVTLRLGLMWWGLQREGQPSGEALGEAMQDCREDWQSARPTSHIFQSSEVPASSVQKSLHGSAARRWSIRFVVWVPNRHAIDRGVPLVKRTAGDQPKTMPQRTFVFTNKGGQKFCRAEEELRRTNMRLPSGKPCLRNEPVSLVHWELPIGGLCTNARRTHSRTSLG